MKLLLFESVHQVMRAEKLLAAAGVAHEVLPTPAEIARECGMCLGVDDGALAAASAALAAVPHRIADAPGRRA